MVLTTGFSSIAPVTSKAVPSVLASVCWSLQCLISTLTQGGGGGHFFRLTCSVTLWGGRDAANKKHWRVLIVSQPHWACPCSWCVHPPDYTAQALGWSAGNNLRPALGCMHLPGLSRSGSGTRIVLRGTDSVGPAFCALPKLQAAWVMKCLASAVTATYRLSRPYCSVFWVYNRRTFSGR